MEDGEDEFIYDVCLRLGVVGFGRFWESSFILGSDVLFFIVSGLLA